MELSEKLKKLRNESGLTQKDLSEKLFVTPQAVSRWENGEVEPSISTLKEMSKIYNVSLDELLGDEKVEEAPSQAIPEYNPEPEKTPVPPKSEEIKPEVVVQQALGVCENCKKVITDPTDLVVKHYRSGNRTYCRECDEAFKKSVINAKKLSGNKRRKISYIVSGLVAAVALTIILCVCIPMKDHTALWVCLGIWVPLYPLLATLILNNTWLSDTFFEICSWGFVKMPGLIFSLDLEGIIWLLTVKLLLWILGFLLAAAAVVLAYVVCAILSFFVYPYALKKSIQHPEED